jgi:hypothetical protein
LYCTYVAREQTTCSQRDGGGPSCLPSARCAGLRAETTDTVGDITQQPGGVYLFTARPAVGVVLSGAAAGADGGTEWRRWARRQAHADGYADGHMDGYADRYSDRHTTAGAEQVRSRRTLAGRLPVRGIARRSRALWRHRAAARGKGRGGIYGFP